MTSVEIPEKTERGYVYILEVKDIQLPVCKIGMTTRTPSRRCSEINKSSTGDFIWDVAHSIAVDNCRKLESLVHSKLSPLRQKGREFFSLNPDDAYRAMISIFENQDEIKAIDSESVGRDIQTDSKASGGNGEVHDKNLDSEYTELLYHFTSILGVKGRPFGQLNKPSFGISDGVQGVQWNLSVTPETGEVKLGVNLEGSEKTGKWLIAPFILSEPDIKELSARVADTESIHVRFSRDAWQGAARLDIVEEYLGGREFSLAELDSTRWKAMLNEALSCLDETRHYRKRKPDQTVTLKSDGRKLERDISPHLTLWTDVSMQGDIKENLKVKFTQLTPIHDWVSNSCRI